MVIGNFALLTGTNPDEVDAWYLGVYMDAIQWVEITNTRGMSQYADGGIVGTKPYVASANYIDKMSNYCAQCVYSKTKKNGPKRLSFQQLVLAFFGKTPRSAREQPPHGHDVPCLGQDEKQRRAPGTGTALHGQHRNIITPARQLMNDYLCPVHEKEAANIPTSFLGL